MGRFVTLCTLSLGLGCGDPALAPVPTPAPVPEATPPAAAAPVADGPAVAGPTPLPDGPPTVPTAGRWEVSSFVEKSDACGFFDPDAGHGDRAATLEPSSAGFGLRLGIDGAERAFACTVAGNTFTCEPFALFTQETDVLGKAAKLSATGQLAGVFVSEAKARATTSGTVVCEGPGCTGALPGKGLTFPCTFAADHDFALVPAG
jgi:hypothetical protein